MGRLELSEGGEWDNCNSIINKYIKKKRKKKYPVNEYKMKAFSLRKNAKKILLPLICTSRNSK